MCLAVMLFLPGCAFHTFKDVRFHLVDAESNQPVAGATLTINYQGMSGLIPNDIAGTTDQNGSVQLRVARDNFAYIQLGAPGYPQRPTDPALGELTDPIELRVYRLPLPYHVLVLPKETWGVLELRMTNGEVARLGSSGKPPSDGQRAFLTTLSSSSVTYAAALPRMGEPFSDYERIFAAYLDDGRELALWCPAWTSSETALPEDHRLKPSQHFTSGFVALWLIGEMPLGGGAARMFFYVGTLRESIAAQKQLASEWQNDARARQINWVPPLPQPTDEHSAISALRKSTTQP
jgi:hypothetical protein